MNCKDFDKMIEWMRTVLHFSTKQIDEMPMRVFAVFIPAYEEWKAIQQNK